MAPHFTDSITIAPSSPPAPNKVLLQPLGCLFGYWAAALLKLSTKDCRTISLETGVQVVPAACCQLLLLSLLLLVLVLLRVLLLLL